MNDISDIAKDYIGADYAKVPYLFSNLFVFGDNNPNIKLWIEKDKDSNIIAVILLYHTCLHFYSKEPSYGGTRLQEVLNSNHIDMIMFPETQSHMIKYFPTGDWDIITDYIMRHERAILLPDFSLYMVTSESEIQEVAKLMMTESMYSDVYTMDNLISQLTKRWKDGFGKLFCYRIDNKLVGSMAITSENEYFRTSGCLIVDKNYRRMGIGETLVKAVASYSYDTLKDCLCFIGTDNHASYIMHEKCENITKIGKIIKCIKK